MLATLVYIISNLKKKNKKQTCQEERYKSCLSNDNLVFSLNNFFNRRNLNSNLISKPTELPLHFLVQIIPKFFNAIVIIKTVINLHLCSLQMRFMIAKISTN